MNGMNVSSGTVDKTEAPHATTQGPATADPVSPEAVLERLAAAQADMPPQLRRAATFLLENAAAISVSSMRQLADAAGVKPNTLVRMARALGFEGFEDFRRPFQEQVRRGGGQSYTNRARWLQDLSHGGELDRLFGDMAAASMNGIEAMFSGTDRASVQAAARQILGARATFVLGMGIANPLARNFAYLASMAVDTIQAIPQDGALPIDALARARRGDVLLAMTFKPYRRDVVEAVEAAQAQGLEVIALTDSPASPILVGARHGFLVPVDTPQFFTSTVALAAFLETLMAFVIAEAGENVVASIDRFHQRRHALGIYMDASD